MTKDIHIFWAYMFKPKLNRRQQGKRNFKISVLLDFELRKNYTASWFLVSVHRVT
jgi:hypothetical protein